MNENNRSQTPSPGGQAPDADSGLPARPVRGRRARPTRHSWVTALLLAALGSHLLPALTLTVGQVEIVVRFR
ncbi:hypothetical protein [Kitasatospora sp. NPDC098663]|uniref:hypothetical protein n=1 Tax=Kitasatospora sp. NPDC098663 TaxID=3364096 RepID=UPI003821E429